ncbi:hypothetical protein [Limnobacter alexandrii]|jgi:hypothetical protein|uniref:hypothetical protein n=1 Tax=Limnobacter alexandrii TaxID=2570352 RepID=UPI001109C7F5|nr:hypothetical protein [Limnobacter alexandrii]
MINTNSSSRPPVSALAANSADSTSSAVSNTFKSILNDLKARPLKPLALQRFSGLPAPRSLAQQIHSDTTVVV